MTYDEAHRWAIEAAQARFYNSHPLQQFRATVESMVNAYLAAMVLPIEEAPKDELVDIWFQCDGETPKRWANCYHDAITNQWRTTGASGHLAWVPARIVTHFTFLPEPPK